jgi:cobalt transporter subunit CbtA
MITRVLLAAVIAGMIAGATATAMQMWRVVPLILQAEIYETAQPAHTHETTQPGHAHEAAEPWAPDDGIERTLYTLLSNIVMGVAFAMMLTAAVMFTGRDITPANGVVWGLLGFIVFTLAPNAGLPPELPGMPAAELIPRQAWWWGTVASTAVGVALIALSRCLPRKALGVWFILLPHLIGAPQPGAHDSAVPAALAADFVAATMVSMALFWIVLGVASGWLLSRARQQAEA